MNLKIHELYLKIKKTKIKKQTVPIKYSELEIK